jgi:hypothetical protein
MKKNVAMSDTSSRSARGERGFARVVGRIAVSAVIAVVCLGAASCAGNRYVRDWTYNGVELSDTLVVTEDSFRLERISDDGTEVFSGRFKSGEGPWRFEIETLKTASGEEHHFDPPLVFVCRGRLFEHGIALFSGRFLGKVPIVLFLRTPIDFDRED